MVSPTELTIVHNNILMTCDDAVSYCTGTGVCAGMDRGCRVQSHHLKKANIKIKREKRRKKITKLKKMN